LWAVEAVVVLCMLLVAVVLVEQSKHLLEFKI